MRKSAYVMVIACLSIAMTACAVGPNYTQPKLSVPDSFGEVQPVAATIYATVSTNQQFWTLFNDELLNQLVHAALAENNTLRAAQARVKQARAIHRQSSLDLLPTITAQGGYSEVLSSKSQLPTGYARESKGYDAALDATWELDLFGQKRRALEAARAEVQGTLASLQDAQIVVIGEVTRSYFELRGQQLQLQLIQRNVSNQQETLRITRARFDAGRGSELDLSRAQALYATSNANAAPLQAAIARSIHRLSVLTGQQPNALSAVLSPQAALPALPQLIAVGDPALLLRRRPDIRVAERHLAADTARVGVAIADLFPHVSFTGSVGAVASSVNALSDSGNGTRLIAPGISWAAFDLGRVYARVKASRAQSEVALAEYQQTVLAALQDTEDALVTHARAREQLLHLAEAAAASDRAAELAEIRYENGATDFLEVLDAQRSALQAQDSLALSRTETATSLVAVYKALGGGWEDSVSTR